MPITMHAWKPVLALLMLLLLFTSCHRLNIDRPVEEYYKVNYAPRLSTLVIPVETSTSTLKKLINREIAGVIYSDTSYSDNDHDNLMLRATRSDSITLSIDRNTVYYRIPLKIWVRKRLEAGFLGYSFGTTQDATAEVALKFKTTVNLNKDWSIGTLTRPDGYEWISYPQMMAGLLKIPLPVIGDLVVEEAMPVISREIDRSVKSTFNLKQLITNAWTSIQQPVKISDEYNIWMQVTPVEVSTVPFGGSGSVFRHSVNVGAMVELSFGANSGKTELKPLPPLKITSALPEHFAVNFSVDIPFSTINEIVRKEFKGYDYSYKRYKINIRDISIYGQGENLIVAMSVEGSVKGSMFLSGKPVFNRETNAVELENLDFSLNTRNVLAKTGSWIFHSGLLRKMSEGLVFPVGDQLREARDEMQNYLKHNRAYPYLTLSGDIDKLETDKILISPASVKAYFQLTGQIRITISE